MHVGVSQAFLFASLAEIIVTNVTVVYYFIAWFFLESVIIKVARLAPVEMVTLALPQLLIRSFDL